MAMALEEEAVDDGLDGSLLKRCTSRKTSKALEQGKGKGRRTTKRKTKKPADATGGGAMREETRVSSAPAAATGGDDGMALPEKMYRLPDCLVRSVFYSQEKKLPLSFEEYNILRTVVSDDDPVLTQQWIKETRDLLNDIAAAYEETEDSFQDGLALFRNEYEERGYIEVGDDYFAYTADVQRWTKKY
ncbi:hypothetical protein E2562_033995 [Oryza meyeriana var. granulata]|uniref:Uncharacterized protein n=1 Tax=Oryza meyeriana var. granulata TaxID=110450 RepID=A0A6G1ES96_9ORYZ|nr:hypothetical protein E2562_033995 [Oryza meyeriana var. granulata]